MIDYSLNELCTKLLYDLTATSQLKWNNTSNNKDNVIERHLKQLKN